MTKRYLHFLVVSLFLALSTSLMAQTNTTADNSEYHNRTSEVQYRFAVISDAHVSVNDTVSMSNFTALTKHVAAEDGIAFVIVLGDVTHNGDYESMLYAKKMLDRMKLPYYVIPGNHDTRNNGCGDGNFRKVFGETHFRLLVNGALFLGVNSGQIKDGQGHFAPEDVEWVKRQLKNSTKKTQLFIVAHHPFSNDETDNWYELTDEIRKRNAQAVISGHLHRNFIVDADGIPNIVCRSMAAHNPDVAYTLFDKTADSLFVSTVNINTNAKQIWHAFTTAEKFYTKGNAKYRPDYDINKTYKNVTESNNKNVGSAIYTPIVGDKNLYFGTQSGVIYAISGEKGNEYWNVQTTAPVMGNITYNDKYVVFGANDGQLYCVDANTGGVFWKKEIKGAGVNYPVLDNNTIYICSANGVMALDVTNGNEIWRNSHVTTELFSSPIVKDGKIVVSAQNKIYAYNINNGSLAWSNELNNYSLVSSVYAEGKIYYSTSNGKVEVISIADGRCVWANNDITITRAIALNSDASIVYAMTTEDNVVAWNANSGAQIWLTNVGIGKERGFCAASENNGVVLFGSDNGVVIALNAFNGTLLWKHKIGNSAVSSIKALDDGCWLIATASGNLVTIKK